jgi:hypothetical protein
VAILLASISAFAQEVTISNWGYGLEVGMGVISGNELPKNYSVSFQGFTDYGLGLSLDFIKGPEPANISGLMVNSGLLGSVFLGLPLSNFFIPYVGGGLGFKFNGFDDTGFAWKVDGGVAAWLSNIVYVKAGVMYDNIRKDLGVSVGVGFKLTKTVSATYRDVDGSTFRRIFKKNIWENNSTPNAISEDKFVSSEVVRTYQKNTTDSTHTPAQYELKTSGGETVNTTLRDRHGKTIATATSKTPTKKELVKTADVKTITYTYVWNVTVTRYWYVRTWYYKDRAPITQRVYQDTESAVLVNQFSRTE